MKNIFLDLYAVFIMFIVVLAIAIFNLSSANAGEINIYDSPSDRKYSIVEYCDNNDKCESLKVLKIELGEPDTQDKISQWLDDRLDEKTGEEM